MQCLSRKVTREVTMSLAHSCPSAHWARDELMGTGEKKRTCRQRRKGWEGRRVWFFLFTCFCVLVDISFTSLFCPSPFSRFLPVFFPMTNSWMSPEILLCSPLLCSEDYEDWARTHLNVHCRHRALLCVLPFLFFSVCVPPRVSRQPRAVKEWF